MGVPLRDERRSPLAADCEVESGEWKVESCIMKRSVVGDKSMAFAVRVVDIHCQECKEEVMTVCNSTLSTLNFPLLRPDDWDDDGNPNDTDLNPLAYDGDNFGPHQTLPEGANSNAYCWVDLVVPDANALVTFTGDGYSALPDPAFIAKAGATNRVILLIGNSEDAYTQVFSITENGTSSVEKFGYRLTRSRWSIWGEATNTQ